MQHRCLLVAGIALSIAGSASACPKCKVATGDLAGSEEADPISLPTSADDPAASQPASAPKAARRFSFAAGGDFTSAYYYRGYLQQNKGTIFQPYLTLSASFGDSDGWIVQPYLGWWNSLHSEPVDGVRGGHGRHNHNSRTETRTEQYLDPGHAGNTQPHYHTRTVDVLIAGNAGSGEGWYETEAMAGVTLLRGDWFIDIGYRAHWFPEGTHDFVHELGAKVSYDLTGLWDDRPAHKRPFALRPWVTVFRELADHNGDENTYMEIGIEPTWKFRFLNQRTAVSVPMLLGGSPDGYYYDTETDDDELLGYGSIGLKASFALPVPEKFGHWYLNGSLTYLHLFADSAEQGNDGEQDEIIGTIGVGVSF